MAIGRGLVVSAPIEVDGTLLKIRSSSLDRQELRSALLFWDELVWPTSRMIQLGSGPEEQYLEGLGVLKRPEFTYFGNLAQGLAQTQIQAFRALEEREPGKWALAQGENSFLLKSENLVVGKGALVELVRAVPVPDKDVPFDEILEFKRKRSDELSQLRMELDCILSGIEESGDKAATLAANVAKVDAACANVLRLGAEWKLPVRLANFKCSLELRPFQTVGAAIASYLAASNLPASQSALAAIGGAALASSSCLKITADNVEWKGLRPRLGPYRYVYQFHSEIF